MIEGVGEILKMPFNVYHDPSIDYHISLSNSIHEILSSLIFHNLSEYDTGFPDGGRSQIGLNWYLNNATTQSKMQTQPSIIGST